MGEWKYSSALWVRSEFIVGLADALVPFLDGIQGRLCVSILVTMYLRILSVVEPWHLQVAILGDRVGLLLRLFGQLFGNHEWFSAVYSAESVVHHHGFLGVVANCRR